MKSTIDIKEEIKKIRERMIMKRKIGNKILCICVITGCVFFYIFTFQMKEDEEKTWNMKKKEKTRAREKTRGRKRKENREEKERKKNPGENDFVSLVIHHLCSFNTNTTNHLSFNARHHTIRSKRINHCVQ